jgi:hypothetical protein
MRGLALAVMLAVTLAMPAPLTADDGALALGGVVLLDGTPQSCAAPWAAITWAPPEAVRLDGLHLWLNTDRPGLALVAVRVDLHTPGLPPAEVAAEMTAGLASYYRAWPGWRLSGGAALRISPSSSGPAEASCAIRVVLFLAVPPPPPPAEPPANPPPPAE